MMKTLRKLAALLMCLCMLLSMSALAEEAAVTEIPELTADTVVATLNGKELLWSDVEPVYSSFVSQYGNYYDMANPDNVQFFRSVALDNVLVENLLNLKAVEMGLSELTEQDIADLEASAAAEWNNAIDNYLAYFHPDLTAESAEADVAAAKAEAEQYYKENGLDLEMITEQYKKYAVLDRVQQTMIQDAVVTDADVEAYYQALVAADKEKYENDVAAYMAYESQVRMSAMYYGASMDNAWYKPDGFRAVRHILLPVDEALMNTYTDLQARFEEQQSEPAGETETTEAPVTEEQVNEAKAAIFASLADKIEEINQKFVEGADFDELITTYGVNADGTPSDPGMASNPYYEVCAASDTVYVKEFVDASMSIPEVGGISAPYLSSFGVHIVKYLHDIPGGPVEMTAVQRTAKQEELLLDKQNELYSAQVEAWMAEANITYTGVISDMDALQSAE